MSRYQRIRLSRSHRGRPRNKALLGVLLVLVVCGIAGLSAVGYVVSVAASAPPLSSLKERDPGSNTEVLAADGSRLGFIQASELRLPADADEFPQVLKDATIAIEDRRFYKHEGIDYEGIIRAGVQNIVNQKTVQGGSTITMQLARNLYISKERTYERKIREAKLAEEIENEHSKEWILSKYLNTVPYGTVGGQSAIGAKAAARIYFDKRLGELTLREAALLAGLPQAPSLYSPIRSRGAAKARRDAVLREMASAGMISPEEARSTIQMGLGLDLSKYFTRKRESYFFDYVKDQLLKEYGARQVRLGGLEVRTTVDLEKQQQARAAIQGRLAGVGPSAAIVTIDPRNGHIEAMASSASYGETKFNLAAQGSRQPGSTFKIMALMAALDAGVDPDSTTYTSRSPFTFLDPGSQERIEVNTYDRSSRGNITLRKATTTSDNTVYIQLALDLGPEKVAQAAWDMGIRSKLESVPSETLGGTGNCCSPLEMANAYATIASGGVRNRPTAITKVTFPDGRSELPPRWKVKRARAFDEGVAAKAREILEENIVAGTGRSASIDCPAGGKTGTTDNFTDAWFVGFTPRLATSVWVGYPKSNKVQMLGLHPTGNVAGGTFPAEIWGDYMEQAKGSFCGDFEEPDTPFQSSPFFGKYASGGGSADSGYDDGTTDSYAPPAPVAPTTEAPEDDAEQETGGDDEEGGFDPEAYESPPQPPPGGGEEEGGTEAPG